MKLGLKCLASLAVLAAGVREAPGQGRLTDVVVFSADASGNWTGPDVWHTRPNGNYEVFIQSGSSGGAFLNGPTSTNVQPNIALVPGNNSFRLFTDPGANYPDFGINLFFNGSSVPSISAFVAMSTSALGTNAFSANAATHTPKPFPGVNTGYNFPGAGVLSFLTGNQQISLTGFYWASPSVYKLDNVSGYAVGPDGINDFVGGITLSVTQVPEPTLALWGFGILTGLVGLRRQLKRRTS